MKAKPLGILLVMFMLVGGFSIVPYILQASFYNPTTPTNVQLPTTNIVDYELAPEQETEILRQGKTIIRFEYSLACEKCLETQSILEQLVNLNKFKDQVVLEEIKSASGDLPKVNIIGFTIGDNQISVNQNNLQGVNVTESQIINSLCNLMIQPPVECALRNV